MGLLVIHVSQLCISLYFPEVCILRAFVLSILRVIPGGGRLGPRGRAGPARRGARLRQGHAARRRGRRGDPVGRVRLADRQHS